MTAPSESGQWRPCCIATNRKTLEAHTWITDDVEVPADVRLAHAPLRRREQHAAQRAGPGEDEGEGDVVAAFYLDEAVDHLSAGVQMVTFIPLAHPDTGSNDETVNWSDLLNISAAGSTSFDFDALKSGSSPPAGT